MHFSQNNLYWNAIYIVPSRSMRLLHKINEPLLVKNNNIEIPTVQSWQAESYAIKTKPR